VEASTTGLRTATYLLRFTPEEKADLEQKVRRAAAAGRTPLSLAEALRMGVDAYLNELLAKYEHEADEQPAA
jgi:formate dehydrogenase maturation protein FdhE